MAKLPTWISKFFSRGGYSTAILGQKGLIILDTSKPEKLYYQIPELRTVINKDGTMFSNGMPRLRRVSDGSPVDNPEFSKLINKPNCEQSLNKFLYEYRIQKLVFGNQFQYFNKPSIMSDFPVAVWNVPPAFVRPNLTGKVFDQVDSKEIISGYEYIENGKRRNFDTEFIIWSRENNISNPFVGESPLITLELVLSNTDLAYKYRNTIMAARGTGIGILSLTESDASGELPVSPERVKEVSDAVNKQYGVDDGQMAIRIVNGKGVFTPTTYATNQLGLFDEVNSNKLTIVNFFGHNTNLYDPKATYENLKHGMVMTYQDVIIPAGDEWAQAWTWKLRSLTKGKIDNDTEVYMDYSHLSILKEDNTKDIENFAKQSQSLIQLYNAGIIGFEATQRIVAAALQMTPEEIRVTGNEIIKALSKLSPLVANNVLGALKIDEARSIAGLTPLGGEEGERLVSMKETAVTSAV